MTNAALARESGITRGTRRTMLATGARGAAQLMTGDGASDAGSWMRQVLEYFDIGGNGSVKDLPRLRAPEDRYPVKPSNGLFLSSLPMDASSPWITAGENAHPLSACHVAERNAILAGHFPVHVVVGLRSRLFGAGATIGTQP